jgi:hypothetical protein
MTRASTRMEITRPSETSCYPVFRYHFDCESGILPDSSMSCITRYEVYSTFRSILASGGVRQLMLPGASRNFDAIGERWFRICRAEVPVEADPAR